MRRNFFADLDPTVGKTKRNIDLLLNFIDSTGGRKTEPDFDENGQPLTRSMPSLESLKAGIELGRMPTRVARRMAQDVLTAWAVRY